MTYEQRVRKNTVVMASYYARGSNEIISPWLQAKTLAGANDVRIKSFGCGTIIDALNER